MSTAGGVRMDIWSSKNDPHFQALPSEPEWKETREAGLRPDLIGTRPERWTPVEWINSKPQRLVDLRGQVVLDRWFTGSPGDAARDRTPARRRPA